MVERMSMRDEDYGAALTLAEGDDGIWSPPMAASACEQPDWRSLYEQAHTRAEKERARADAAQARAEELRRAEVDSRSRAGSLKWQLDTCRNKLKAASEETKEVRRGGEGRAFLPGGSGAAGNTPFASRRRVEQAQHDHVAAHGSRPAAQGGEGLAGPNREPGRAACQASRDWDRVVEGALRAQERAAGEAALRAQARSAARRRRPWPHAAARARGTNRRAQSAEGCAGVFLLREALRGERRAFLDRHRDRSQGPHTQDRPSPVAPELRLRIVAPGSVGAPGAAAVPQDALRDQLLGTLPVRALCLLPAPAPRCRVAVRPGAGGLRPGRWPTL